jgi:hypothetical protein
MATVRIIPANAPAFVRYISRMFLDAGKLRQDGVVELPSLRDRAKLLVNQASFLLVQDDL